MRLTQPPLCSKGLELLRERELRVGEELHLHLPVALVSLQRLEDRLGRQPFVDEERQRRHVERQPLGLAGPVEEWLGEAGQFVGSHASLFERARVEDLLDERLAALASDVLAIPVECGRQRRVVPVGLRRLALGELRLRPDLGP
jgi:hypothetical protein